MSGKKGGLLDILFQDKQHGGGAGDGYAWHRENAINNLQGAGEAKRNEWLNEVRDVKTETGMDWKDALQEASRRRKQQDTNYQTWKQRVVGGYTGRQAQDVNCAEGKKCPGRYTKAASTTYRPGAHYKRPLSQQAAISQLRKHYREIGLSGGPEGLKKATKAMRQDISKKRAGKPLQPCPTRLITVTPKNGAPYQRRVVQKTAECADNWLYRGSGVRYHDMVGVDYGDKKDSGAYGKRRLYAKRKVNN